MKKSKRRNMMSLPKKIPKNKPDYSFFMNLCASSHIPKPTPEFKFHDTRKWRMDFAWPNYKLALEIEGGVHTGGRHTRGAGFEKDIEKYNEMSRLGWRIIRITPENLYKVSTIQLIIDCLKNN